jgi:hypothetical protein
VRDRRSHRHPLARLPGVPRPALRRAPQSRRTGLARCRRVVWLALIASLAGWQDAPELLSWPSDPGVCQRLVTTARNSPADTLTTVRVAWPDTLRPARHLSVVLRADGTVRQVSDEVFRAPHSLQVAVRFVPAGPTIVRRGFPSDRVSDGQVLARLRALAQLVQRRCSAGRAGGRMPDSRDS